MKGETKEEASNARQLLRGVFATLQHQPVVNHAEKEQNPPQPELTKIGKNKMDNTESFGEEAFLL